jgi:hypothetical protein
MAQQTAVEWLIKIYLQTNKIDNFDLEVAKEMEKEQIISAHLAGANDNEDIEGKTEIEYYNETYNK